MAEAAGASFAKTLGELDRRRVRKSREHDVLQRIELTAAGPALHARVAVPEQVDPPGADRIEDAAAFEIVEPCSFSAAHRHEAAAFRGASSACMDARPRAGCARAFSRSRSQDRLQQWLQAPRVRRLALLPGLAETAARRAAAVEAPAREHGCCRPDEACPGRMQFATQPAQRNPEASICRRVSRA